VADGLDLMHALVLDNGRRWGEVATDVQRQNARAVLESRPGEARLHWYEAPKGYSKSTDTAGLSLAWLVADAPGLVEGYVIAGDLDQANRLLDKARGLVARSGLVGLVRVEAHRLLHVRTSARVVALAADAPTAEGLLSPLFICDEVPRWPATRGGAGDVDGDVLQCAQVAGGAAGRARPCRRPGALVVQAAGAGPDLGGVAVYAGAGTGAVAVAGGPRGAAGGAAAQRVRAPA